MSDKKKVGRPSDYTQEKADDICARISEGQSIRTICAADGMPDAKTLYSWIRKNDEFLQQYARAKEEQADALVEQMLDIADGADGQDPARDRLRLDARKWIASKLKAKKYGDKTTISGDPENPIDHSVTVFFK